MIINMFYLLLETLNMLGHDKIIYEHLNKLTNIVHVFIMCLRNPKV